MEKPIDKVPIQQAWSIALTVPVRKGKKEISCDRFSVQQFLFE